MNKEAITTSLDQMYSDLGMSDEAYDAIVDRSLNPRGPDMLFDKLATLGVRKDHHVLDIGCRDAGHAVELARQFGCSVMGIDPVQHNVVLAKETIRTSDQADRVRVLEGRIEAIPTPDASFDFIWCRDMLNHVPDLQQGFAECVRVLKPGGNMLVFQTLATELLEPHEAQRLYPPLVVVPENMAFDYVMRAFTAAGFHLLERDIVSSEWRERWEEDGTRYTSQQLLRIARMRRDRDHLIATLGQRVYESEYADCHWGVYQMLGKLCPNVYILEKVSHE